MGAEISPVDLSGGKYDEFETLLSKELGLKTILVRGWKTPDAYYTAQAMFRISRGEERAAAEKNFKSVEQITLGLLRANIADRDPEIGHDLTDNDLRSLLEVGHVTRREGNSEPEQAVIVFDPGEPSPYFPARNPALTFAMPDKFDNAWSDTEQAIREGKDYKGPPRSLEVNDLIENFDISAEDARRYEAVAKVKYALHNQSEFNNLGRKWYYEPNYFNVADIAGEDSAQMYKAAYEMPYSEVVKKFSFEVYADPARWGIKDPEFFEKLKLARAVKSLVYSSLMPSETFARLKSRIQVNDQKIAEIKERLTQRIDQQIKKRMPETDDFRWNWEFNIRQDWRILFPIFREIYEKDKSTGPEREYLDTIMAGLQKFFPAITNAPVPKFADGHEPLRKVEKNAPSSPRQQFAQPAAKI